MLRIEIFQNNINIGSCSGMKLGEYSKTSLRELTFLNCTKSLLEYKGALWESDLKLHVHYEDVYGKEKILYEININCIEPPCVQKGNTLVLEGQIIVDHDDIYEQEVIDIFMLWQENREFEWNSKLSNEQKFNYLGVARLYTSWSSQFIIENTKVELDTTKINDQYDFFYYVGELLLGNRGCLGSNPDRFTDYIQDIVEYSGMRQDWGIIIVVKDLNRIKSLFSEPDYELISGYFRYSGINLIEGR